MVSAPADERLIPWLTTLQGMDRGDTVAAFDAADEWITTNGRTDVDAVDKSSLSPRKESSPGASQESRVG